MEPITDEEVNVKRAYIRDQAKKRLIQGDHHECFRKYRHQHSRNWMVERCIQAIMEDKTFRYDAGRCEQAMLHVLQRLNRDAGEKTTESMLLTLPSGKQVERPRIGLDHIGNKSLLYNENTPWIYLYQKDGTVVNREMCLVMNELARIISGREDDWWKNWKSDEN